jgi:hypothetical protein
MISLIALVASFQVPCANPDQDTAQGQRMILAGERCLSRHATLLLTPAQKAEATRLAKDGLNDPASAQFRWLPFRRGGKVACATINARNSFGGYVGFQFMAIIMNAGKVTAVTIDPVEANYLCSQEGYIP